jgi:hypothetical protein
MEPSRGREITRKDLSPAVTLRRSCRRALQTPQGSGRQRLSFSVSRLRRGMHRPAAAALRLGACYGVIGIAALPRLRWFGVLLQVAGLGEGSAFLARLRGHGFIRP